MDVAAPTAPDQAGRVRDGRFREALVRAMAELPAEQREIFELRQIQGLKVREIAAMLGVGERISSELMASRLEQTSLQNIIL